MIPSRPGQEDQAVDESFAGSAASRTGAFRAARTVDSPCFLSAWREGRWDAVPATVAGEAGQDHACVADRVSRIVADVRERGQAALIEWTARLDQICRPTLEVARDQIEAAAAAAPAQLVAALELAASRILAHARQQAALLTPRLESLADAGSPAPPEVGEYWLPLARVGCYVPGGRAPYASTVLMTVLPAKAAGVAEVILATPPASASQPLAPALAAAARLAGADRVFAMGGAQAIAALAFGAGEVPRVDRIVGPGNAYVTEAKRQLYGQTGIDGLAGPSEIVAVCGRPGSEPVISAQLLAQAEHDPEARAIGVLLPGVSAAAVAAGLQQGLAELPTNRQQTAAASLAARGGLVLAANLDAAAAVVQAVCPEHLWLDMGQDAADFAAAARMGRWAGAVYIGRESPPAFGDYVVGANHVLPTSGSARWGSPLSPLDFLRRVSVVRLSRATAEALCAPSTVLATAEGFHAHARSCIHLNPSHPWDGGQ
jgi:histidinol dehydrogenase